MFAGFTRKVLTTWSLLPRNVFKISYNVCRKWLEKRNTERSPWRVYVFFCGYITHLSRIAIACNIYHTYNWILLFYINYLASVYVVMINLYLSSLLFWGPNIRLIVNVFRSKRWKLYRIRRQPYYMKSCRRGLWSPIKPLNWNSSKPH